MKNTSHVSVAIIIGSLLISTSILVSGGSFKLRDNIIGTIPGPTLSPKQSNSPDSTNVSVSFGKLPSKGSSDAKIGVVEFADFRCPFCKSFFDDTEPQLLKDYINNGKVKFAFRHFEFLGPASVTAGNAVECANDQGMFWDYYSYLYKNQPSESDTSMYTTDKLTNIAGGLGLDATKFSSCLSANRYNQNISQDQSDAKASGVTGTPSFIIGKIGSNGQITGKLIVGAQPYSVFKATIDSFLK